MFGLLVALLYLSHLTSATWVKEMENENLFEGDIVMTPEERAAIENGENGYGSTRIGHWSMPIPYTYSPEIAKDSRAVRAIQAAIAEYHKHTCVRFVKRANQRAHIYFQGGSGCSSPVGYNFIRGKNRITLAGGCRWTPIVMHEMAHSLGFYHEQSRPDRDDYVTIIKENIPWKNRHNFWKYSRLRINSLGTPYDFSSIMHYGNRAFSKNGGFTIKTKDPSKQYLIGQRRGFSPIDIKQINMLYNCKGYLQ